MRMPEGHELQILLTCYGQGKRRIGMTRRQRVAKCGSLLRRQAADWPDRMEVGHVFEQQILDPHVKPGISGERDTTEAEKVHCGVYRVGEVCVPAVSQEERI